LPKNKRHYRLTDADVLAAHEEALTYGGRDGILDWNLVASAISRPYSTFDGKLLYRRIWAKSAALLQSLAQNHGFVDGNKRTSLICLMILIERSGYSLRTTNDELESLILDVAQSRIRFDELVEWMSNRIVEK
jgi:death-on-curing protein